MRQIKKKQSTNIKCDEINIKNINNDNTFNLYNSLLNNDNRYMKVTLMSNRGYPRGVMVKAMDCGIIVREFVLQSRYYVHIQANTLGKGMNPFILLAMG